ncbi:MAG: LptF/LptG family permease [Verrucomicrobia bacterium]|jgi:lipopolysaccharide export system permease protein|nr:LptF/LptG family permease [Verrucomicrobiota bacterium]
MRTLYVYLTKQILATTVMTVAVFAFVLLLGNIMKEILALLVNGQASFLLVGKAFLLLVPFVLVFALPMGMLTATLLLFGRLSADQELTAMRSGGISLFSLTAPVLALSMLMSMLCAWINLDIAPYCRSTYKQLIRSVDVGRLTDLLQPGVPMTDIPDQFIQIEERKEVGEMVLLRGIRYVKFEKDIPVYDILAEGGTLEANESNNQLFLSMTNCTVFQRNLSDSKDFEPGKSELDESNWFLTKMSEYSPSVFTIDRDSTVFRKPKLHHMSFRQLQQEMKERQELADDLRALPSFDVENMRTELAANVRKPFDPITPVKVQMHRQIAFSYACFAFTLIGIPLGIRAHRRETSIGIAIALMLVAVYYGFVVLANALENHGEWAPHLIMWFPNFLFQAVGCVLFWRANKGM